MGEAGYTQIIYVSKLSLIDAPDILNKLDRDPLYLHLYVK
jgi:hypothetical protein